MLALPSTVSAFTNASSPDFFTSSDLDKLNISFHLNSSAPHQYIHMISLMEGMRRHGLKPHFAKYNTPVGSDVAVVWSWKQRAIIADAEKRGAHVLVIERGFIQPRTKWCSLAFNGLNGHGKFVPAPDNGERWQKFFSYHLKPWRTDKKGYALLIGQRPDDVSLGGAHFRNWVNSVAKKLIDSGHEVVFRPHPRLVELNIAAGIPTFSPEGTLPSRGRLAQDLAGAACCITFSSNTSVEAILAGIPTYTEYDGSIAWPVTSHNLDNPFYYPDRLPWCHDMAWKQWTLAELSDGSAWGHVKKGLIGLSKPSTV